jgi:hypothetical protein
MVISSISLLVALASSFLARANVDPSEPSPGAIFNEGQQCTLSWNGDPDKSDAWKSMNIALMTGDNFHMIQLLRKQPFVSKRLNFVLTQLPSAIGTTFDGTTDGQFSYPCPDVRYVDSQLTKPVISPNPTHALGYSQLRDLLLSVHHF